jgi:hypothetical protein
VSDAECAKHRPPGGPRVADRRADLKSRRGPEAVAVDDPEQRPDGKVESELEPWLEFFPAPGVHADFSASSALAVSDEQRAAGMVEIGFGEGEGFLDAQSGAPQDHDQATEPAAVCAVTGGAHDGDDLLDLRWIGCVAQTLVARRATGVEPRHGRRRATPTGAVQQQLRNDPSSGSWDEPEHPSRKRHAEPATCEASVPSRSSSKSSSAARPVRTVTVPPSSSARNPVRIDSSRRPTRVLRKCSENRSPRLMQQWRPSTPVTDTGRGGAQAPASSQPQAAFEFAGADHPAGRNPGWNW